MEILGNKETVHVKNTGRCAELLVPGATVYVQKTDNPERKTQWDLIGVEKGNRMINMDSQIPNKVVEEWIRAGNLFPNATLIKPEKTYKQSITIYLSTGVGKTTMPDLKGMTKAQAVAALEKAGLIGEVVEVNYDEEEGMVIDQELPEGTELDKGTTVKYTVSIGKEKIQIPKNSEFAGKTYSEVVKLLEDLNGDFRIVKDPYGTASSKYEEGLVVRVEEAGEAVEEGATITIVLSTGSGDSGDVEVE